MPVLLKIKCFVWLVIRVRIAARDRLQRLGILREEENMCLFCNMHMKHNRYLFVH